MNMTHRERTIRKHLLSIGYPLGHFYEINILGQKDVALAVGVVCNYDDQTGKVTDVTELEVRSMMGTGDIYKVPLSQLHRCEDVTPLSPY